MMKSLTSLCLISILSCGIILISTNCIQASTNDTEISKPSVPEFTVRLVAYPYDVPSTNTTKIDQYTGKETVITTPGYHVENKSIEIVIENPPFTSYTDEEGHDINLYYDVQVKGHFGDDWETVGGSYTYQGPQSNAQLDSEYTTISIEADDYPSEAVLDFRVQTLVGYYVAYGRCTVIFGYEFYGQKSGWNDTQTLNLNSNEIIPEFPSWTILPLLLALTAFVATQKKKLTKTNTHTKKQNTTRHLWRLGQTFLIKILFKLAKASYLLLR